LTPQIDVDAILVAMTENTRRYFDNWWRKKLTADNWVHLRKSNTEPIIRIYTEAASEKSRCFGLRIIDEIKAVAGISKS
jgi:phosphomannomutase